METTEKRPVGRPRLSEEEKKRRAEMREQGLLPRREGNHAPRAKRPNWGQEHVEPGDNSRYLSHAMAIAELPMIDINSPVEVQERIEWYFTHCFQNDMKPTVSGLCNALKISRDTLMQWKRGTYRKDTHQEMILSAYRVMESLWEDYAQNGKMNPTIAIFLGCNNYGYQDVRQVNLAPIQAPPEQVDVAAIEAKYDELPEGDA